MQLYLVSFFIFASLSEASEHIKLIGFLQKIFESEEMRHCSAQLFNFHNPTNESHLVIDTLNFLTNAFHISFETSGAVISEISSDFKITEDKQYRQPEKRYHAKRCSLVIVVVNTLSFPSIGWKQISKSLTFPPLRPPTIRNRDKYLILTNEEVIDDLEKSKVLMSLKYKLVLGLVNHEKERCILYCTKRQTQIYIKGVCQYGLCNRNHSYLINIDFNLLTMSTYSNSVIESLFPDHEKNFFGYTLRLSTTTNVPQLLEMRILKDHNGKNILKPKRGSYAPVLLELSRRLNFTYEIVPSSGNGSTGHALPNGTWVGTVGDTHKGIVDFGLMAAITYDRFPYAEFCAPINFAYLGFVTGPPRKSYPWNAILWPFSPTMWFVVFLATIASSKFVSIISQYSSRSGKALMINKKIKWTHLKGISFLTRGLLGQCEEPPENVNTTSFRTFLTFWLLFCLVITTAYSSKMVSLLTFPSYDPIPNSFDELANANDFLIDFHYFGNVGYSYFKSSTNPSFIKIYNRMGKEPNPLKCLQRTLREKVACIIFIVTYEELLHRNLSDQYGKSPLKFTRHEGAMFPAGVIHEHKAPLSSNFQSVLFPAMESGIIPFWQDSDLNEVLKNKNRWQKANNIDINTVIWGRDVNDNLLRVRNLKGAFITLFSGIITSFFTFSVEKAKSKMKRKFFSLW